MDLWGIEKGLIGVGDPDGAGAKALKQHPDRFIPSSSIDPNDGMEGIRPARRPVRDVRGPGRGRVPGRHVPAGADQRQEDVPDLRQVRGAGHPDLLLCRRSRAAAEGRLPARRAHRRGDVRLSRPGVRDPPRLRAMDRAGRQADAQVAGTALLDECLRAEVLPAGHHRLRQQPAVPTRSSMPGTSRWGCRSSAS